MPDKRNFFVQGEWLPEDLIKSGVRNSQQQGGRFKKPTRFSGADPQERLMQMRQYYELEGFKKETKIKGCPVPHKKGRAHVLLYVGSALAGYSNAAVAPADRL